MISDLDIDIKSRFLVLHLDAKMKLSRIHEILGTPIRTLQDWARKIEAGKDIRKIEEGRGTKPKVTSKIQKKILRKAREHPEKASTRKLGAELKLSKTTIHEVYREKGLIYGKLGKRPDLSLETKEDRMTFCQDMLEENGQRIYETFFSDEMGIKLSDAQLDKGWYKPQKKLKKENLPKNMKVNCWGAISSKGSTSLHIFKDNLTASVYRTILDEHKTEMEELYPEGFYFQHDNHTTHQASKSWMEKNGLEPIFFQLILLI